ncbi:MAG: tail fiber domain-containing protein [Saprospiraceae bacterium]|nr:tail fiber domain-containing protein [Saprospiraceae bacterium]
MLIHSSDRNRKEDIEEVNYRKILDLVNELPVSSWQYKGQAGRHLGPMAQDFYSSFGLGNGDTGIASVDADGVALAAIKALINEVEKLKERISELENSKKKHQKKHHTR